MYKKGIYLKKPAQIIYIPIQYPVPRRVVFWDKMPKRVVATTGQVSVIIVYLCGVQAIIQVISYVRVVHCLPNFAKHLACSFFSAPSKWLYVARKLLGQCRCVHHNRNELLSGSIFCVVIRNEKRVADKPISSDCCCIVYLIAVQTIPKKSRKHSDAASAILFYRHCR